MKNEENDKKLIKSKKQTPKKKVKQESVKKNYTKVKLSDLSRYRGKQMI